MKMKKNNKNLNIIFFVFLLVIVSSFVIAQPSGTTITYNSTGDIPDIEPANRTDDGGTITTLILDALQQNYKWKAYVGNVTGTLTLDDSDGNTIFDWALAQEDITGEVYSSRSDSVNWGSIACTSVGTINDEHTFLNMNGGSVDSINATFNETTHPPITIGTTTVNSCPATSTFVSSTRQAQGSADFPIVLLHDNSNLVYSTLINPSTTGYDGSTFDFQMIMANDPSSSTLYYFYVELG
jgi:hypothetical protein